MKRYKCHKEAHAEPMNLGDYYKYKGWTIPEEKNPLEDGYFVVYNKDTRLHNEFWIYKNQFDDGYNETKTDNLTLGEAVEQTHYFNRIQRDGWNGSGMFVFRVADECWTVVSNVSGIRRLKKEAFLCMRTASGTLIPWVCSQTDALANDWRVIG